MVEAVCRYLQSGRCDDEGQIETRLVAAPPCRSSTAFSASGCPPAATGSTKHACLDNTGRMSRVPKALHDAIAASSG